jgi:hypothetical protein
MWFLVNSFNLKSTVFECYIVLLRRMLSGHCGAAISYLCMCLDHQLEILESLQGTRSHYVWRSRPALSDVTVPFTAPRHVTANPCSRVAQVPVQLCKMSQKIWFCLGSDLFGNEFYSCHAFLFLRSPLLQGRIYT